jgi:uncharacterized protein
MAASEERIVHRDRQPGAEGRTPLIAVSRSGSNTDGVRVLSPDDLLTAYRRQ